MIIVTLATRWQHSGRFLTPYSVFFELFVCFVTYVTDVQTEDGQLVSIQRQEELEQRRELNIRTCGWTRLTGPVMDLYLQRVCVEEFDGAI